MWTVVANIFNKQSRTAEKGWPSSLGVGRGTNNSSPQKVSCYGTFYKDSTWSKRDEAIGQMRKTAKRGALCFVLLIRYLSGDQIKKNEKDRACSTYGGEQRLIQNFGGKP
jgi:hypothetical protein